MVFRRRYSASRRAAWLAVFALLLQTLVPAFHHPASMALGGTLALGEAQHLCLAPGSTPVAPSGEDKVPHHHLPACAICQAVHAIGGFAAPPAPMLAFSGGYTVAALPHFDPAQPRPRLNTHLQPRAPPATA